jgi:hypothetical protein
MPSSVLPIEPDREPNLFDDIRTELLRHPELPRMTLSRRTVTILLDNREYWRDLYLTAVEVGQEVVEERNRLRSQAKK